MPKRPYSTKYTARANPRRYLLSGIPPTFWEAVKRQAKKDGLSVRQVILDQLALWLMAAPNREHAQQVLAQVRETAARRKREGIVD